MRQIKDKDLDRINELASELHDLLEEQLCAAQAYMEERSDRWHESEAGQEYESWARELEDLVDKVSDIQCIRQSPQD